MRRTAAVALFLALTPGFRPSDSDARQAPPVPIRSDVMLADAHSVFLRRPGTTDGYRIFVALPSSYSNSDKRYPVLYTLDANASFAMITETYRLLGVDTSTPELVLVGIGYDVAGAERRSRRSLDLTPTRLASDPNTGGGEEFLRFVGETLIPFVDSTYRTVPGDRGIHGHSLGGAFALYSLFQRPELFKRYIASSPSLWWDGAVLLKHESEFSRRAASLDKSVFLSVGAKEPEDMRMYFGPFVDSLRSHKYSGLRLEAVVLPDEDHLSIFIPALVRGLRAVYRSAGTAVASVRDRR